MPQSATSDVNVAIMRHRETALKARLVKDFDGMKLGIFSMNGCLPEELKLRFIPMEQYKQLIKPKQILVCKYCNRDNDMTTREIQIHKQKLSKKQCERWNIPYEVKIVQCEDCNAKMYLGLEKLTIFEEDVDKFEMEFIPKPPQIDTLNTESKNVKAFLDWFDNYAMPIMEDRCRKFRNMYSIDEDGEEI